MDHLQITFVLKGIRALRAPPLLCPASAASTKIRQGSPAAGLALNDSHATTLPPFLRRSVLLATTVEAETHHPSPVQMQLTVIELVLLRRPNVGYVHLANIAWAKRYKSLQASV